MPAIQSIYEDTCVKLSILFKTSLLVLLSSLFVNHSYALSEEHSAIIERIKPVGTVCIEGATHCVEPAAKVAPAKTATESAAVSESVATPVEAAPTKEAVAEPVAVSEGRSGETIYKVSCAMCHASGAAGAPIFADASAWVGRIAKGKETLYQSAIKGFQAMPAQGLCMDCSDAELKASVDYMVENAQ